MNLYNYQNKQKQARKYNKQPSTNNSKHPTTNKCKCSSYDLKFWVLYIFVSSPNLSNLLWNDLLYNNNNLCISGPTRGQIANSIFLLQVLWWIQWSSLCSCWQLQIANDSNWHNLILPAVVDLDNLTTSNCEWFELTQLDTACCGGSRQPDNFKLRMIRIDTTWYCLLWWISTTWQLQTANDSNWHNLILPAVVDLDNLTTSNCEWFELTQLDTACCGGSRQPDNFKIRMIRIDTTWYCLLWWISTTWRLQTVNDSNWHNLILPAVGDLDNLTTSNCEWFELTQLDTACCGGSRQPDNFKLNDSNWHNLILPAVVDLDNLTTSNWMIQIDTTWYCLLWWISTTWQLQTEWFELTQLDTACCGGSRQPDNFKLNDSNWHNLILPAVVDLDNLMTSNWMIRIDTTWFCLLWWISTTWQLQTANDSNWHNLILPAVVDLDNLTTNSENLSATWFFKSSRFNTNSYYFYMTTEGCLIKLDTAWYKSLHCSTNGKYSMQYSSVWKCFN